MERFTFSNPTKILFGEGQIENVGVECSSYGKNVLLVTGKGSVKASGLYDTVTALLKHSNLNIYELSGVDPNPRLGSVMAGAKICKENNISVLLGVGGGSVVDCSKAIAAAAMHDGDPWDFIAGEAKKPTNPLPVGVVLTMAATGSEANGNSVISKPETNEKKAFYHAELFPQFSILDPALTITTPREQTAYGIVDILSHIFEQYFHTVKHAPIPDGIAETLMRTVINAAPVALAKPSDINARSDILWASTLALNGLIKSGVKGDWSCHTLSHGLSGRYDIAHGAALAIIFPCWMRRVFSSNTRKFVLFAKNIWGIDPTGLGDEEVALLGIEALEAFFKDILRVGVRLEDYGIDEKHIDEMAESVVKNCPPSPLIPLTKEEIVAIYRKAL